jgi:sulfate adenylyltransferase
LISPYHGGSRVKIPNCKIENLNILPKIQIDEQTLITLSLLKIGILSPLDSFQGYEEAMEISREGRMENGLVWSMPVLLPVTDEESYTFSEGDETTLHFSDKLVALMKIEEKFSLDMYEYCNRIFGTTSIDHPGVKAILQKGNKFVSGHIKGINNYNTHFSTMQPDPDKLRGLFNKKGFKTVTAFQTRNPPHRGHEFLHKYSLLSTDALFINPVLGPKKSGDFSDQEIFQSYQVYLDKYLPKQRTILLPLIYAMQYAGPREAIMHMIMRKNLGCTHFVIGRDHAGVGSFYGPYAARDYVSTFTDIGIEPVFLKEAYYCKACTEISNDDICPHDDSQKSHFSGTKIRDAFLHKREPYPYEMRGEIYNKIIELRSSKQNTVETLDKLEINLSNPLE